MAGRVVIVTTPDVVSLRGVRRLSDLLAAARRCARTRTSTSCSTAPRASSRSSPTWRARSSARRSRRPRSPTSSRAFEAGRQHGRPGRAWRTRKLRGAVRRASRPSSSVLPGPRRASRRAASARGLLVPPGRGARPVVRRGRWACCPCSLAVPARLWQLGLVGYTYMLAGHAAREGARELADRPDRRQAGRRDAESVRGARPRGPAEGVAKGAEVTLPEKDDIEVAPCSSMCPSCCPGLERRSRSRRAPRRRSRTRSCRRPSSSRPRRPPPRSDGDMSAPPARRAGPGVGRVLGMLLCLLLAALFAWQLLLGRLDGHRRPRTPRAPPAACSAARRRPGEGRPQRALGAAAQGLPRRSAWRATAATVIVQIPFIVPGLTAERLRRRAQRRAAVRLSMGLRTASPRTATAATGGVDGSPTTASGCSRRSTSPSSPSSPAAAPRAAGARGRPHGLAARGPCCRRPSARG